MDIGMKTPDGGFTLRAAALIINDNKLLVIKHDDHDCFYTIGGRIKMNETSADTVIREVREETGHPFSVDRLVFVQERFYNFNNVSQVVICKRWFLPSNTYDCGSFVVNRKAVIGKANITASKSAQKGADVYNSIIEEACVFDNAIISAGFVLFFLFIIVYIKSDFSTGCNFLSKKFCFVCPIFAKGFCRSDNKYEYYVNFYGSTIKIQKYIDTVSK